MCQFGSAQGCGVGSITPSSPAMPSRYRAAISRRRAFQLPALSAGGNVTSVRNPKVGPIPGYEITQGQLNASASWNVDFWGRYRRATEAARAILVANEWAQKEVMATLVANVASSYFQLRQLEIRTRSEEHTSELQSHSDLVSRLLLEKKIHQFQCAR